MVRILLPIVPFLDLTGFVKSQSSCFGCFLFVIGFKGVECNVL